MMSSIAIARDAGILVIPNSDILSLLRFWLGSLSTFKAELKNLVPLIK